MSVTKLQNLINPEVMGDMINAKVEALLKLTPYAKVDTTLQGVPGDTKTVPSWNYIGDAEDFDVEAGVDMDTTNLTASSRTFTIKCAGKSVSIYQTAINSGLGNPIGQAETQLAKSIAGKVDTDVVEAAYTGTVVVGDGTAVIGYAGIVDAVTKFEDEEDGIEKVMFIHPKQEATLLKDGDFLSADKFTGGVAVNGSIGKIAGCWVKKSKKVKIENVYEATSDQTVDNDKTYYTRSGSAGSYVYTEVETPDGDDIADYYEFTASYYLNPIVKLEADSAETEYTEDELPAITIFLKKETQTDHEWFPKAQRHDITTAKYYGVALTNDAKVVLAKFKA